MATPSQPETPGGPGGDPSGLEATLTPPPSPLGSAPDLLASMGEQRRRDELRARLFGGEPKAVQIGRFSLLHRLGAGGMGVVYAAYDEQLDRKVALKLLRASPGAGSDEAQARLLREAQALAKLAHPNVVAIHDIGVFGGQVFIAMEFIQGRTLRAWLQEGPRGQQEVLDAYLQAGKGLLAAHEQGLVHRDFKPDNVMVGDDGRVRVVDFGLVRASQKDDGDGPSSVASGMRPPGDPSLTAEGAILGTPAYMAPEQFLGDAVDGRTDQFSFCVALHEGLYGERPFEADTIDEMCVKMMAGAVREPRGTAVPGWLRAAVLRGLRPRPEERWPSMRELLAALAPRRDGRRRAWGLGAAAIALAAIGALGSLRGGGSAAVCGGARGRVAEAWGPTQRGAVREAVLGSGLSFAADTWPRLEASLDRRAEAWASMHEEACFAHRRGDQSSELLDLRMACLERRRGEFGALIAALSTPREPSVVEHAVRAVGDLEPLDVCADVSWLRAQVKPPRGPSAAQVRALEGRLAAVRADLHTGLYERGVAEARAISGEARGLGYLPLVASTSCVQGAIELRLGLLDAAERSFEEAYELALGQRDDGTAAKAATSLLSVLGHRGRADAARPWERSAGALAERVADRRQMAEFLGNRAVLRADLGDYELALEDHRRSLATLEELLGPRHPDVALRLHNMGIVLHRLGRYGERVELARRALSILEETLGPEHPEIAVILDGLAMGTLAQGNDDEAIELLLRARSVLERGFGEGHHRVVQALMNLATARSQLGQTDEALALYQRALASLEADPSPNQPRQARLLANLGAALVEAGRPAEAVSALERALALQQTTVGLDHPDVAHTQATLGTALASVGRDDRAADALRAALAILDRKFPPLHPRLAPTLLSLGELHIRAKNAPEAVAVAERALAILSASGGSPSRRAAARFLLARALAARAREADLGRARQLAEQSLAEYEEADAEFSLPAAQVKGWLLTAAGGRPMD